MNQQTGAGGEGMAKQKKPAAEPQQIQFSIDDMIDPQPVDTKAAIASFSDTVQKTKEAIEAAAAPQLENLAAAGADAIKESFSVTQEELQRLMELPLSQIEALPKEKQEIVWQEIARQMTELPEFETAAANFAKMLQSAHDAATAITDSFAKTLQGTMLSWDGIAQSMADAAKAAESAWQGIIESSKCFDTEALHTMTVLSPYIDKEYKANKAKYEHAEFSELIAAAAALARADGIEIPPLKAEEAQQAQKTEETQQTQEDIPETEKSRRENIRKAAAKRNAAQADGALVAFDKLGIIAEKGLGFSYFTSAVIKALPNGIDNYILNDDGAINLYDLSQKGGDLQEVDRLHTAFLMWLLNLAYNNSDIRETNSNNAIIPVYVPAVLDSMKVDPRPRKRDKDTKQLLKRDETQSLEQLRMVKFMEFVRPLLNYAGYFGESLYQIVGFHHYDLKTEYVYLTVPYMFKLVEYAKLHADKHGAIVNVFHGAGIMTENQTAVEIANRIAIGVITRGVSRPDNHTYMTEAARKPTKKVIETTAQDGKKTKVTEYFPQESPQTITRTKTRTDENGVTTAIAQTRPIKEKRSFSYSCRFSSFLDECPQLRKEIDDIRTAVGEEEAKVLKAAEEAGKEADEAALERARKIDHRIDPQRINKKLKDIFTTAVRIIMEKTVMPQYYKDLTITTKGFDTFKAPTSSTLNGYMVITHKGKNPDFVD